ncbi:hypothetical protein ABGV17_06690 [Guyparkeria sp. GHLCS8-2]|uniref:hypothetical protein n=1 Tax=Guyparkeria halopsychrophila TaxID=3139421 RepID=UPI0037C82BBD
MKYFAFILVFMLSPPSYADNVFSDDESELSFRYHDNWSEREPQLHTTLVLLYADNGSDATCNLSTKEFAELKNLSEAALNQLRATNHTKSYFSTQLSGAFDDLEIKRYWRGAIGQKDAGLVELSYNLFLNDSRVRFTQFMGSTFARGRRITLTCNAPAYGIETAKKAFDYIRNTMLFLY